MEYAFFSSDSDADFVLSDGEVSSGGEGDSEMDRSDNEFRPFTDPLSSDDRQRQRRKKAKKRSKSRVLGDIGEEWANESTVTPEMYRISSRQASANVK